MASIEISEESGVRYLHFGSEWVQGAMRIARPWSLELEYTRAMMMALLLRGARWPASALQVGLGSASTTRFLYRYRPRTRMTVVEIVPEVVAAARQFFKLPDDTDRLGVEIGDGYEYMATQRRRFDFIVVDGFDAAGRMGMLDTAPFYLNCRERLSAHGVMAINLLTGRRGSHASLDRIRSAFDDRVLVLPRCAAGNTVALAAVGAAIHVSFEQLRKGARTLRSETGLDLEPTVDRLGVQSGADGDGIVL
jgi:spermidine synthase